MIRLSKIKPFRPLTSKRNPFLINLSKSNWSKPKTLSTTSKNNRKRKPKIKNIKTLFAPTSNPGTTQFNKLKANSMHQAFQMILIIWKSSVKSKNPNLWTLSKDLLPFTMESYFTIQTKRAWPVWAQRIKRQSNKATPLLMITLILSIILQKTVSKRIKNLTAIMDLRENKTVMVRAMKGILKIISWKTLRVKLVWRPLKIFTKMQLRKWSWKKGQFLTIRLPTQM